MTPIDPSREKDGLKALERYRILDTASEKVFDNITTIAAEVCETPIALLSFIDRDRQWFKSNVGMTRRETSRDIAFCSHAIMEHELMIVPDALADDRFSRNPLVLNEPQIRFYAGMPLITPDGHAIGTLCVIDRRPRELTEQQKSKIEALAQSAMMLLEVRRSGETPA